MLQALTNVSLFHRRLTLVVCLAVVGSMMLVSAKDSDAGINKNQPESDVAGNRKLVPANTVMLGVRAYYKVFGVFPERWADVVSEGLVQTPLTVPGEGLVDPDDGSVEFPGDVAYMGFNPRSGKCLFSMKLLHSPGTKVEEIEAPQTYRELFMRIDEMKEHLGGEPVLSEHLEDIDLLKLCAIAGICNGMCLSQSLGTNGRTRATLETLLNAGFLPIDLKSINPVTDRPFKFERDAGELSISVPSEIDGNSAAMCIVYDRTGKDMGVGIY